MESIISEEQINIQNTFYSLSKYINLYIKSGFNINKYKEGSLINKNELIINPNSELNYYSFQYRENLWHLFLNNINNKKKEYFITGPHGNGKTFTLLGFVYTYSQNKLKAAYYNLEALNKSTNYFDIIIYESRNFNKNIRSN